MIFDPVADRAFLAASANPGQDGLIAFAGRLVEEKGVDSLIRAVARIPDVRLEIAGDGEQRSALEALAIELGVRSRIRFLGMLDFHGVAELYAKAAVVCVPSAWHEPFGYAAAEAMAMGRPVVATPTGALVELLEGGRGFLASESTPAALADALRAGLEQRELRARVAEAGRAFAASQLTADHVGRQYEGILRGTHG